MKRFVAVLLVVIAVAMLAGPVEAHRHHWGGHHHWGGSYWWGPGPYWAPNPLWALPYYVPPPVVRERVIVVPAPQEEPQTYVQQQSPPVQYYWHFCRSANGYYPYVPTCPEAWERIPTQPPK